MIGTDQGITPSGIVYLFGEQFVELAKVFGITLLHSGARVKIQELGEMLYGLALLGLQDDGLVRLELAERKRLLGLGRKTVVAVVPLQTAAIGGLEGGILRHLVSDPTKNDVADLLKRQIGQDLPDPWLYIIEQVRQDVVTRGFLQEQREARQGLGKLLGDKVTVGPVPERIASVAGLPGALKASLAELQRRQPQLAAQLWKDMRRGFQSRIKPQDNDDD